LQGKIAIFVEKSGYWVKSTRMQRMTASDALHSHPSAFENAVFLDCLYHIFRTGRSKAAVISQMRGDDLLVEADEECKYLSH
jgi:hypothetical protein